MMWIFARSAAIHQIFYLLSFIYYLFGGSHDPYCEIQKIRPPRAVVPTYATPGAAAADLCALLDAPLTLAPMQRTLVPTGLAIELPDAGCVALVYARSGLSIKHGLCMANGVGVIDSDYRGELRVPMVNLSDTPLYDPAR